jgi:hypothetical protein
MGILAYAGPMQRLGGMDYHFLMTSSAPVAVQHTIYKCEANRDLDRPLVMKVTTHQQLTPSKPLGAK